MISKYSKYKNLLKELSLLSLFIFPIHNRSTLLYWALSDNNSFSDNKLYLNLGFWKNSPANLDEAGDQLAHLLAETASLNHQDVVLDVGCGFGYQDIYWLKNFDPQKISGINISENQIASAIRLIQNEKLQDKITYIKADATYIPFANSSFDVVFSLEASFHFNTREDFFREAFRVLKPGGRLVLSDLTTATSSMSIKGKIMQFFGCNFWQVPSKNRYDMNVYNKKLIDAGFNKIQTRSIWNDVYPPWLEFIKNKIHSPEVKARFNFIFRYFLTISASKKEKNKLMDYILVYAEKPMGR